MTLPNDIGYTQVNKANELIMGTNQPVNVGFSLYTLENGQIVVAINLGYGTLGLAARKGAETFQFKDPVSVAEYYNELAQRVGGNTIQFKTIIDEQGNPQSMLILPETNAGKLNEYLSYVKQNPEVQEGIKGFVQTVLFDMSASWFLGDNNPLYSQRLLGLGATGVKPEQLLGMSEYRVTAQEKEEWDFLKGQAKKYNWSVGDLLEALQGGKTLEAIAVGLRQEEIYQALIERNPILVRHVQPTAPSPRRRFGDYWPYRRQGSLNRT